VINLNSTLPPAAPSSTAPPANPALPTSQGLNDMFMQLLLAQLKNQSPLSPMDPTQFVGQLAQFSELSEVTQIYQLLQQGAAAKPPSSHSAAPGTNPSPAEVTSAILSSAASAAAKAAIPNFTSSATSFFNHKVQGVF
jgi:hypothetical protein